MKYSIGFSILSLLAIFSFALPAGATFPGNYLMEANESDYQKVHQFVMEKKFQDALNLLNQRIETQPQVSTYYLLKGFVFNEMGNYLKALHSLRAGERLVSRHPSLHFGFCQVYRNLGIGNLSERACIVTAEQNRNSPETHYELAQTLMVLGKMEGANKELAIAAELEPENPVYPLERGLNFNYLNRGEEAKSEFLKALSLHPENLEANYQLAYLHSAKKEGELARPYIMKILESRKQHSKVQPAKLLLDRINKNALDNLPGQIVPYQYHQGRSKSLYQSGKYGLALIGIQTAARLKPEDLLIKEIMVGLCSVLLRLDLGETAVEEFLELAGDNPTLQARGYQELGDIRVMQGKLSEAKSLYEKARSLGDPNEMAQITLNEFPQESASVIPKINPNELFFQPAEALNRKGELFARHGMYERAIAIYALVLRLDPNHLFGILNTAAAYFKTDRPARAILILERLFITHPKHPHIVAHRLLLAQAYVKNGDLGEGLKNLELAVRMNPAVKQVIKSDPAFEPLRETDAFNKLIE